jgi:hypothetical protein
MKLSPKRRSTDSADLAHFTEVINSRGYELMRQDLTAAVLAAHKELEGPDITVDRFRHVQGVIAGLRKALRLPAKRLAALKKGAEQLGDEEERTE